MVYYLFIPFGLYCLLVKFIGWIFGQRNRNHLLWELLKKKVAILKSHFFIFQFSINANNISNSKAISFAT